MKIHSILLISLILISNVVLAVPTIAQETKPCEQCGMNVDSTGQARFKIIDANGQIHIACCPVCTFKMLKTNGQLTITSFCDYNGPSHPITITAKNYGSTLTVNPPTAQVILGGGCAKNRLVYNPAAADSLLVAPNNGQSQWLSPLTNATVASNATRLGIAQAILQFGGGMTLPCDQCGMDVDTTGQAKLVVSDASGTLHPACCPICALKMLKTYGDLNITTFCDYYGPTTRITINSKNYGGETIVTPSTALVILGGSCTRNRIVSSEAAADLLLLAPQNGTSSWLSPITNATVAANATRIGVAQAALQFGGGPSTTPTPTPTQSPTQTPTATKTSTPKPTVNPSTTPTENTPQEIYCELCGMVVTEDDEIHFELTDGTNQTHKVECIMCALNMIKWCET